ncbi:hypothetical protein LPTSP3_g25310 [Leptospira kobayashii]|uniref:Lipoprotein n=1 Tax=Leptospira kobayashii TaxID=1917830 RepID=A0ABM7UL07_9LEPT|nr:hypothetical protein [Leptospira kobayashii]BDA79601.1 hypothetical protein LPTSP3_g25310 [Leptospira kobayashii]
MKKLTVLIIITSFSCCFADARRAINVFHEQWFLESPMDGYESTEGIDYSIGFKFIGSNDDLIIKLLLADDSLVFRNQKIECFKQECKITDKINGKKNFLLLFKDEDRFILKYSSVKTITLNWNFVRKKGENIYRGFNF